jgi:hypothetical protein
MVSWDNPAGMLILASYSRSGNCFFIRDDPPNDTEFGSLAGVTPVSCKASNTASVGNYGTGW